MNDDLTEDEWDTLGFVVASEYRPTVMEALTDAPKTPSMIQESIDNDDLAHISRALSAFVERDMAECKNPNAKKGRIYALTEKGEQIYEKYEEMHQ